MDGSPDRAGVVLGSSEASLPLHCPQDAIRDVHVKGLMYQWIARDMGKGAGPCCGCRGQRGAGPHRSLLPPHVLPREVHPARGRDVRRAEPPGGPREAAVPHHQQSFQLRVSPPAPAGRKRDTGTQVGWQRPGASLGRLSHSAPLRPGTRGCGTWWVPTGASSLTWSSSRRTSPASSPTDASKA